MKKFIYSMIMVLICTISTSAKTKDPYHLLLEGSILHQKNVHFTVFKMNEEGTFVKEARTKVRKNYYYLCDVGARYIVRFDDKTGNTKFLMLDVTKSGEFTIDVDFSRSYDAVLRFTKNGYSLTPLSTNPVARK